MMQQVNRTGSLEGFFAWMEDLNREGVRRGYHEWPLQKEIARSRNCWIADFHSGLTPAQALDSDYNADFGGKA